MVTYRLLSLQQRCSHSPEGSKTYCTGSRSSDCLKDNWKGSGVAIAGEFEMFRWHHQNSNGLGLGHFMMASTPDLSCPPQPTYPGYTKDWRIHTSSSSASCFKASIQNRSGTLHMLFPCPIENQDVEDTNTE
ncbi:unnamed protein product [Ilex paraguariensis]|uniref:Uncharacterized protein n=1 Tax=Ilex paraguariensis TaxID=185542 RepID=A0ABC8TG58_9AQUA